MCGNPGALEQGVEERPRNSARKVYGGRFSAEFFDDARNINSATARVIPFVGGAVLSKWLDALRFRGAVNGGVESERDDRFHELLNRLSIAARRGYAGQLQC